MLRPFGHSKPGPAKTRWAYVLTTYVVYENIRSRDRAQAAKTLRELTRTELNQELTHRTADLGGYSVNNLLNELRSRDTTDAARRTFWTAVASSVAAFFSAVAAVVTLWLSLTHH